ncbi:MAG: hypothetical protein B7Y39_09740 [Bdellovibrio sp. 28-41-41]|nr:MAG: hypothetical protein B7Y39_09740 [Bdellovibrio sp. 28-41-41]
MKIFIIFFTFIISLNAVALKEKSSAQNCILGDSTHTLSEVVLKNRTAEILQQDIRTNPSLLTKQTKNVIHQAMNLLYSEPMDWNQAFALYTTNDIDKFHGGAIDFFTVPADKSSKYVQVTYYMGVGGDISGAAGVVFRIDQTVEFDESGKLVYGESNPKLIAQIVGPAIDFCTKMH